MDRDRLSAKAKIKELPAKEKIKYFWSYYKKHVIVLCLVLILVVGEFVRCMNKIDYDMQVYTYTTNPISSETVDKIKDILKKTSEDINDNGSVDVEVYSYTGDVNAEYFDQATQAVILKLQAAIFSSECPVYITDEYYKDYITEMDDGIVDKVIDLSQIPEFKEALNITEDEKLFWVSMIHLKNNKDDTVKKQFDNSDIIEKKLFK